MNKYSTRIIVIVLSCLLFISCTSHQKYPAEWAELVPPQGESCPDISGTYVNLGETAKRHGAYLSTLFDFGETPSAVTQVQIRESDHDRLEIAAWGEQKLLSKKIYSRKNEEYTCSSKGMEIPIGKIEKVVGPGESDVLYLVKSADGTLIIEKKSSTGGYSLLYIPMVASSYEWYRFKAAAIMKH